MYNQAFTPKELYSCVTQSERRNSRLDKEGFINAIETELGDSLIKGTYRFQIKQEDELYLNGRKKKDFDYLCQNLVIRKLYKNIKRIYSVQQADRNTIIKQIITLLNEDVDMWVVRLDVKHFYEAINREKVLKKLQEDARLSYQSLVLLQSLFNDTVVANGTGVPRGLGVSAGLSELYMKYFDLAIRRVEGVYYYARFVDDIIVFCSSASSGDLVWKTAELELKSIDLELNEEKSYIWQSQQPNNNMIYLGYGFQKVENSLEVTISEKKVNVIKTRLTKTFVRYANDRDYDTLKLRIKFLTGNFTLYQVDTLTPIKVGLFFNYKMATKLDCLSELDNYYQRLLHCQTGKLGSRVLLTRNQVKELEKYSFRFGYGNHVNHHFTISQMSDITRCWL